MVLDRQSRLQSTADQGGRAGPEGLDAFIIGQMESSDPDIVCHGTLEPGADYSDWKSIHWTWTGLYGHEPNAARLCAISRNPNMIDVFSHGPAGTMFTATYEANAPGDKWSAWKEIATNTTPAARAVLEPGNYSFGTAEYGTGGGTVTISVRSSGSAPLVVNHVGVEGPNPRDFKIVSNNCLGRSIAPDEWGQIVVRFHPVGTEARQAKLRVSDNAPDSPHYAHLVGYGLEPAVPPVDSHGRPTM